MLKEWSKKKISVVKEKMFCGLSKEFGHEYGKAKKKSGFIQKKIRSVKFKLYKKWREEIDKREFLEMKEFLENMPWRPLGYTLGYYDKEYDAVHSIFDYTIGDEKKELKQDCFKKIFQDNKNDSIVLLGNNATRAVKIYYRIFIFFKSLNDYFEQKSDRNTIEILQSMWTTPLAKLTQEDIEDMKQELRGVKNLVDGKTLEEWGTKEYFRRLFKYNPDKDNRASLDELKEAGFKTYEKFKKESCEPVAVKRSNLHHLVTE